MKYLRLSLFCVGLILLLAAGGLAASQVEEPAASVTTAFSYQGYLVDGGVPANGIYDFRFSLYTDPNAGNQIGPYPVDDVPVENGVFTAVVDISTLLFDNATWLEVEVRPGASTGGYSALTPRQPLTTVPYANTALTALIAEDLYAYNPSIDLYGERYAEGGRGVYGLGGSPTGVSDGVWGRTNSPEGRGVLGWAPHTTGANRGVWGQSDSIHSDAAGVYGLSTAVPGSGATLENHPKGVWGVAMASEGIGVYGESQGVLGVGVQGSGEYAVTGLANPDSGTGVTGVAAGGIGVHGSATNGFAVYAAAQTAQGGYAGYFVGNVYVSGSISGPVSRTQIDHPLDPANQYLNHFGQTAPEAQNVYNGITRLDARGAATVVLPDYFSAVNGGSYRYQLTAVGAAMPNLHVARELDGRSFAIAGGEPGLKVSWEVTATRDDPYLRDHPASTEEAKPDADRGSYLYPAGHGQPAEMGPPRAVAAEVPQQP